MTENDLFIRKQLFLKAPPERVWQALTSKVEFAAWFNVEFDAEFKPGQQIWMTASGQRFSLIVLEMTPPHVFRWKWHPGAVDPSVDYSKENMTEVEFRLEPKDGGTLLTLVESGFGSITEARRPGVFADNVRGWDDQIVNFERYVASAA